MIVLPRYRFPVPSPQQRGIILAEGTTASRRHHFWRTTAMAQQRAPGGNRTPNQRLRRLLPPKVDGEITEQSPGVKPSRVSLAEWSPSARDLERFGSKVCRTESCWLWTGARTSAGYGSFAIVATKRPVIESAHRVSFRLRHGRAPAGVLMHSCDTPACINPAHLVEGTNLDNMRDARDKGGLGEYPAKNLAGPGGAR